MAITIHQSLTGVQYLQRYVLRHVVANEQQDTQRMSEEGRCTISKQSHPVLIAPMVSACK